MKGWGLWSNSGTAQPAFTAVLAILLPLPILIYHTNPVFIGTPPFFAILSNFTYFNQFVQLKITKLYGM